MFKFGGVDKKEFKMLKDFMLAKENFFKIRNFAPDAEEEDEDDDDDEDEEDEDFNSDVASVRMSIANVLSRVIRYHKYLFSISMHVAFDLMIMVPTKSQEKSSTDSDDSDLEPSDDDESSSPRAKASRSPTKKKAKSVEVRKYRAPHATRAPERGL